MSWGAVIVGVGTLASSVLSSNAQKDAAAVQADAIKDAQGMTDERYNQIRQDALGLFDNAMADTYAGMQEGRDLLLSGQASTQDIINQSFMNASQTLQTSGQQAINAMLGVSGQAPTVQNIQTAEQSLPPEQQTQPVAQPAAGTDIIPSGLQTQPVPGELGGQQAAPTQETGLGQQFNPQTGEPWDVSQENKDAFLSGPSYGTPEGPEQFPGGQLPGQAQPLEGDFIPAGYQGAQTGLDVPQGQFGLAGATQSLRDAEAQTRGDLALGTRTGLQGLSRELGFAGQEVRRGRDFGLNQMQSAMDTGRGDITGAMTQGRGDIQSALSQGRGDISAAARQGASTAQAGADRGVGFLNPYMQAGQGSIGSINALSGLSGQEAFDSALMDDPAYRYALERSEQSLGRQSALTGGIGGGNIAAELQRNAQMQAAADIDRQLGRMSNVRNAGLSAAGTAGGLTTQAGIAAGGMQSQAGRDLSSLGAQAGRDLSGLGMQGAQNLSNISMQGGREMSNIGINASSQIADLARTMGISEMQAMQMLGQNLGQASMNTGQQIGGMQNQTGLNMANLIANQGQQQANLQSGYGQNLANLNQGTATNLANQAQNYGGAQAGLNTGLAALLSNAGAGQASQQANLGLNLGNAQAAGVTNPYGNALSTMTGIFANNPQAFGFGQTNTAPQGNAVSTDQFINNNQGVFPQQTTGLWGNP